MGPIFYYIKIWLELTLGYFYNSISVGFMTIFFTMLARFRITSAFVWACLTNTWAVISLIFFVALTGYETVLSMRFDGSLNKYLIFLFVWNILLQSFFVAFLSNRLKYKTQYLVLLTVLSNIGAGLGMVALVKYHMVM